MSIRLKHEENGIEKVYTLEFTRKSVETMERTGFQFEELRSKPVTMIPMLFHGAFLARHKYIKKEVVDELFTKLSGKNELFEELVSMLTETVNSLMGGESEDEEKNVTWEKI